MPFESSKFAIAILGEDIKVEQISEDKDLSNFDFLIIEKSFTNHDGNKSYTFDIKPLKDDEYIEFYNWKILDLHISGNWHGEFGRCKMLDYFGKEEWICLTGLIVYEDNRKEMIETTLIKARDFAKNNYSIEYYNFIMENDFNKPRVIYNFRGFGEHRRPFTGVEKIKRTQMRLEQYNKLMGYFQDQSKRTILLRERLSSAMAEYLIQYCRLLEENSNEEVRQILDDINTEER